MFFYILHKCVNEDIVVHYGNVIALKTHILCNVTSSHISHKVVFFTSFWMPEAVNYVYTYMILLRSKM